MTVVTVLVDPPRPGLVLADLAATSPLSEAEAAECYAAMCKDTFLAAARSGGDLLVNYRPDDLLPDEHRDENAGEGNAEAEVRAVVAEALGGASDVRVEVQVGSTFDARAGNTATYLIRDEGEASVAIVRPTAAFLARTLIDSAAMKLRNTPIVLGPAPEGRVHYAAFTEPIDYTEAFAPPELTTLTRRARDADLDVDFLPMAPVVERGSDLPTALSLLEARRAAGRIVPKHFAAFVDSVGLRVVVEDGEPTVVRG